MFESKMLYLPVVFAVALAAFGWWRQRSSS